MASALVTERTVLDELEPRWRKLGYTLLREPSPEQLPAFLQGFRPDAIAIGPKPALVIEVLQARNASSEAKVRQLRSLFDAQQDWRLEVVYISPEGDPLRAVTSAEIRSTLRKARDLAEHEPRASLLLGWSALEAIGRLLEPSFASRSLAARSLVDLLVANGHVPQSEGAKLRGLGDLRNGLAHGQLDISPTPYDVRHLVTLAERLIV